MDSIDVNYISEPQRTNQLIKLFKLNVRSSVSENLTEAYMCLLVLFSKGITSTSLTEDNISVMGNMCCILDGSYIQNSDPSILDKLNSCPELTDAQAAAVEALLQSGKTKYGYVSRR